MKPELNQIKTKSPSSPSRILYGAFILLALVLLCVKDYNTALINFAIALVFDPFDPNVCWENRPSFQKIWLMIHLSLSIIAIIVVILFKH